MTTDPAGVSVQDAGSRSENNTNLKDVYDRDVVDGRSGERNCSAVVD